MAGVGRLTERDVQMLGWICRHRFVHSDHVARRFGLETSVAYRRLRLLLSHRLLTHQRVFHSTPGPYLATLSGLHLAGSGLPPPRLDVRTYHHDWGVVDLAIEAETGGAGTTTEREARHLEAFSTEPLRFAVSLPPDPARRHFPDLVIESPKGRTAVELELTPKGSRRLRGILSAYGWAPYFDTVVYYVGSAAVGRRLAVHVHDLGLADRVRIEEWAR